MYIALFGGMYFTKLSFMYVNTCTPARLKYTHFTNNYYQH